MKKFLKYLNPLNYLRFIKKNGLSGLFGLFSRADTIRAYWYRYPYGENFGDAITPYLIKKMTGKEPLFCSQFCLKEYYIICGSVISRANRNAIIWGAGIEDRYEKIRRPKKILAVRGPLTRQRLQELGYDCPEVYGDPTLLLPNFYIPQSEKRYKLGIIPHCLDYAKVKEKINSEDILVINVLDSVEKVLDDIYSCEKTLSSSLHGIIASNTYGIASTWVEFSKKLTGDGSKFIDYFLSINTKPYKPVNLINEIPNSKILIDIANKNGRMINQIDIDKLMKTCPFNCQWKGDCLPKDTKSFIVLTKK